MTRSDSLFEEPRIDSAKNTDGWLPLATRMRPRTIDEFVGQEHILGQDSAVRKAIEEGKLSSVILWAPPGCGKTTLAYLIAKYANADVESKSAVTAGVADIRQAADAANKRRKQSGRNTLLILDEIHHFNRSQQGSLLGYLEEGVFQMVGVTTESPFFVLAPALLSRARILPLKPLTDENVKELISRAMQDEERGLGMRKLAIDDEAINHLVKSANGDARLALNALEAASLLAPDGGTLTVDLIEEVLQRPVVRYDQQGDYHYDTISAFIKSVRGSDADAAIHYLARMLVAGEDPRFIMRRLLILASEDIGNADPNGLVVAVAAAQAVERVGMPESNLILAQATIYLATAPKSNRSTLAIANAQKDVESKPLTPIPLHLRNAPVKALKKMGHGEGYKVPHDFPGGWVEQQYMPEGDWNTPYYEPSEIGFEKEIKERKEKGGKTKEGKE
jgi:putative ATPase